VQFGGQTPLKLAKAARGGGHSHPRHLSRRHRSRRGSRALPEAHPQAEAAPARQWHGDVAGEGDRRRREIGYPVVIRPSYVLGGRAMQIVYDREGLERYTRDAVKVSGANPVLIDSYLRDAIEVDVYALADKDQNVFVAGIMEHIEEAGIHYGDSACSLAAPFAAGQDPGRDRAPDRGDGRAR